jgi:hypothetical protein
VQRHLAPAHEGGAAKLADERPLARVHAPVLVHVALLAERLAAKVAAENENKLNIFFFPFYFSGDFFGQ